jgi:hypothetical protein
MCDSRLVPASQCTGGGISESELCMANPNGTDDQ